METEKTNTLTLPEADTVGCYCVCHSPLSSRAWCDHCKGDNEVARRYRERSRLEREVIEAAKAWRKRKSQPSEGRLFNAVCDLEKFENGE